jgi:hypothetical protein
LLGDLFVDIVKEAQVSCEVVVELAISGEEEEAIHSERALARCGELKGSCSVWRAKGRIRLDPVRNRVGFVCHSLSNRE